MSNLRQALYGIVLLGALALLIWGQQQRITVAEKNTELAAKDTQTARDEAGRLRANLSTLQTTLNAERNALVALRAQQDQLRQGLAKREQTIEGLKRENSDLRAWADQPLPEPARRLRQRPTIVGAAAYRAWLSGSGALRPAGD
jgi:LysB family phage lysis regulatory protein